MITIDGSQGEGGGQILRSSLALSLVTGKPFCIEKIRAGRGKPGLLRQHLTAVHAATEVGEAEVTGDVIGSTRLSFVPRQVRGGSYHWSVGTAGSATLVLQTVLPSLLTAKDKSELVLEGGTHNPYAPPFDFLSLAFLPVINQMGPKVVSNLERSGFYPAGGGKFTIGIEPASNLMRVDLMERGEILRKNVIGIVSRIPRKIAESEIGALKTKLSWPDECFSIKESTDSRGPGNVLICIIETTNVTEVFTAFGERGVPAQRVAAILSEELREYVSAGVPVGRHLADQLIIPMALAGGGAFRTLPLTRHSLTNIEVTRSFLDVDVDVKKWNRLVWNVEIKRRST